MIGSRKASAATALLLLAGAGLTVTAVDAQKPMPTKPAPAPPDPVPQLLFLGEKRPMRFRLDVRFLGKPYQHAWEAYMGRLFAHADVNGDKFLSQDEAQRLPEARMLLGLLQGRIAFFDERTAVSFADIDANKDGKISPDEMKTYYRKNGFGPLQSQFDPEQGSAQILTDALFKHLDLDKDGKLSKKELEQAEKTLAALDVNEDDLLTPEELVPGLEFGFGRPMQRPGRDNNAPTLSLINPEDPPAGQAAPLLSRYDKDKDGKLSPAEIGFDEATFKALDANKDGFLDATELAGWFKQPADLELLYPLSGMRPTSPAYPMPRGFVSLEAEWPLSFVAVGGRAPALAASLQRRDDGTLLLTTDGKRVEFRRDRGSEDNLNNLRRFYREQFTSALRDKKKYLEKKDVARNPFLKGLFPIIDRDGDGKATEEEFNAFLDLIGRGATSFTVVMIGDRGAGLFDLLDTNRDRQLSLRELRAAWQSVAAWDANKDGSLAADEVPRYLRVTLCAGMPARARFFGADEDASSARTVTSRGPLWFRRMDVNGDGDVSRREWLGSDEDFRRIDADGDGLISLEEAVKADGWYRKKVETGR
jgi:Ca2+-binding EF-hand superfamily protein